MISPIRLPVGHPRPIWTDSPGRPLCIDSYRTRSRSYITHNHLGPGDALPPEGQLAQDLGVSRSSVREAVKALESLGILEVRHGNGLFVREFNFDAVLDLLSYGLVFDTSRISDILQIRKWLETSAIGEVIACIGEDDIRRLEESLDHWEAAVAAGDVASQDDRAFHQALYQVLGNHSLLSLLDIFWAVFHAVPVRAITTDQQPTTTVGDHRAILEAVRARDVALARRRILEHFHNLDERIAGSGHVPAARCS